MIAWRIEYNEKRLRSSGKPRDDGIYEISGTAYGGSSSCQFAASSMMGFTPIGTGPEDIFVVLPFKSL